LDHHLPKISADQHQIHQVLMNLSVNARDAMPLGGTLSYCTSVVHGEILRRRYKEATKECYVVLTVTDTGMGMDEGTLQKIFDPFFTTKEVGKGTGLGMSVVQGIIQSHNGFIDVRSRLQGGTEIELYLPVSEEEQPAIVVDNPETASGLAGNETVLLIEDEELTREVVDDLLHSNGYRVIHARDGAEGVDIFRDKKDNIQIVVSDLGLPKFNGDEVYRHITAIDPNVHFILMSGYLEPELKARLLMMGVSDILPKPFRPADLLSMIRKTLDSKHPLGADRFNMEKP
jgi:CheY-like chemotaxis protein